MTSLNSGGWEFRENEIAYIFMYIYMFFTYVERFNNNKFIIKISSIFKESFLYFAYLF